jgi:gliding motility-associated-like protein
LLCNVLWSQDCEFDGPVIIEDSDTTSVTVLVDGLTNDVLGENGQALCGVEIELTHEFIGDIIMRLYSPSGQEVILMGPPTTSSAQTDQITWDVTFRPCGNNIIPDAPFDDVWNNFNSWASLTTYTGEYYPFNGCLEDFNGSSASGVWSLSIIDGSPIGDGELIDFELIFCDSVGLSCFDCGAIGGAIQNDFIQHCESDADISVEINPDFIEGEADPVDYNYSIVVSDGSNQIVEYSDSSVDLNNYTPGVYSLCGLSYLAEQENFLPAVTEPQSNIAALMSTGQLCGEFSQGCIVVEISPSIDTTFIAEEICLGQSVSVGTESFTDAGMYTVNIPLAGCDSLVVLDLEVIELRSEIEQTSDDLTCEITQVTLDGSSSILLSDTQVSWRTDNGNILSDPNQLIIQAGSAGVYWLILDSSQCSDSLSFVVANQIGGAELSFTADILSCTEPTTTLQLTSTVDLIQLNWEGPMSIPDNVDNFEVTIPGNYFVTVTDENSCIKEDSFFVNFDYALDIPVFSVDTLECDEDQIQINATIDNESDYIFNWSNEAGFSSTDLSPLVDGPGLYILEVTNGTCTETHMYYAELVRDLPYKYMAWRNINCINDGLINLTINEPYDDFTIKGPNGFTTIENQFSTTLPGTYVLCLNMTDGCVYTDSVSIISFTKPSGLILRDTFVGCENSPVELRLEATHVISDYIWSGPNGYNSTLSNPQVLDLGKYFVTVTSAWSGCETMDSMELTENMELPEVSFDGITSLDCSFPQSLIEIFTDANNPTYEWTGPQTVGNVSSEFLSQGGEYTVVVTDDNQCSEDIVIIIDQDAELPRYQIFTDHITCDNNGVATVNLVAEFPGYTYAWSGPSGFSSALDVFTVTEPGTYVVSVTGQNGCSNQTNLDVYSTFESPVITNVIEGNLNCDSENVILGVETAGPVENWVWSGPNNFTFDDQFPVVDVEGQYTVTLFNESGCFSSQEFNVELDTISPIVQLTGMEIDCNNSKAELSFVTNVTDFEFVWTGPANFDSDVQSPVVNVPGLYTLTVFTPNGCGTFRTFEVVENFDLPNVMATDGSLPCDGSSLNLNVSSADIGTTFEWTGPNFFSSEQSPEVTEVGEYIVVARGLNGCIFRDTIIIDDEPILPIFGFESGTITCRDSEVTLIASDVADDMAVEWISPSGINFDQNNFITSEDGDHLLIVTGNNGCLDSAIVNVDIDTLAPLAIANATEELRCEVLTMRLDGSDSDFGIFYEPLWEAIDGGQILADADSYTPLIEGAGTYILNVTDTRNGCIGSDTIMIEEFLNTIEEIVFNVINPTCEGFLNGSVNVTEVQGGVAPYTYSLNDGFFTSSSEFLFLAPEEYSLTIRDNFGCTMDTVFTVAEGRNPTIDLGPDRVIELGDNLDLEAIIGNISEAGINDMQWSISDFSCNDESCLSINISPLESVRIFLEITDDNGCEASDDVFISIKDESPLYVPNVFSPNGDDSNDLWMIFGGKGIVEISTLNILDRWGNIVFENFGFQPENEAFAWDGIYRGEALPAGVYAYILTYDLIDGSSRQESGQITLLR